MKVKNKWNLKIYEVVKEEDAVITLKRENGSMFMITKSEFHFSYKRMNNT